MDFIVKGKVSKILPEQRFKGKNGEVVKNAFVVQVNEAQFQKNIVFSVFGSDKWEKYGISVNEDVEVHFDISCRSWNDKWFTELQAWKVLKNGQLIKNEKQPEQTNATQEKEDGEQLPF